MWQPSCDVPRRRVRTAVDFSCGRQKQQVTASPTGSDGCESAEKFRPGQPELSGNQKNVYYLDFGHQNRYLFTKRQNVFIMK